MRLNKYTVSVRTVTMLTAYVFAALPVIRILSIICTTGADTLSDDYLVHLRAVVPILTGAHPIATLFQDSYYRGHLMVFPTLFRIILARTVFWNTYVELLAGVSVSLITLFLLHNALTARSSSVLKVWMWTVLSALLFSVSQIDQFTYGDASIPIGFSTLGTSFIVWSMVRFGKSWRTILLAIAGAWFASWSWGEGLAAWPLLFGSMIIANAWWKLRVLSLQDGAAIAGASGSTVGYNRFQFALVIGCACIALAPYFSNFLLSQTSGTELVGGLLNPVVLLSLLGLPFTNGTATSQRSDLIAYLFGLAGIVSVVICIVMIARAKSSRVWRMAGPGCFLCAWSLLNLWQISLFRTTLAPWYAGIAALFWSGVCGLIYALIVTGFRTPRRLERRLLFAVAVMVMLIIATGWTYSNRSVDDKVSHLYSRAPASSACIRAQQTAPTLCQQLVILGLVPGAQLLYEYAELMKPLQISVFAPNQRWTLQGDYVLDTVSASDPPGVRRIQWLDDQTLQPRPWYDYHHLDLQLPTSNTISWTVYLPRTAQHATLHSAVIVTDAIAHISLQVDGAAVTPLWSLRSSDGKMGWQSVEIDLMSFRGQTMTLTLASVPGSDNGSSVLFRYPLIDVLLDPDPNAFTESQHVVNIKPVRGANDIIFEARSGELTYTVPSSVCLGNYTQLSVRMGVASNVLPRVTQWSLHLAGVNAFGAAPVAHIPLLGDSDVHEYAYALKLLDLKQDDRLASLSLMVESLPEAPISQVYVADVRLTGYRPGDYCK